MLLVLKLLAQALQLIQLIPIVFVLVFKSFSTLFQTCLPLLHARVTYLNDSITLALENYYGLDVSTLPMPGLFHGCGHLSRMLFGTAMNEDVEELKGEV